jgi:N-acetylglutamate synthase-like GNAT family acetyltransferase
METLVKKSGLEIVSYSSNYRECFKKLNYEWIENYLKIEDLDKYVLANPEEAILDKGGFIFFAKWDGEIIGTFALVKVNDDVFELSKMAVTEKHRKNGIGKELMKTAIRKARELNLKKLILYSNTSLISALNMYINFGFRVTTKDDFHSLRSNIKMQLLL